MPVIDILIRPNGSTRMFFDCRDTAPDPSDQWRIEQAIERSIALGGGVKDTGTARLIAEASGASGDAAPYDGALGITPSAMARYRLAKQ
jgi:hypothetical protein